MKPFEDEECDLCWSENFKLKTMRTSGRVTRLKLVCLGCGNQTIYKVQNF